MDAYRSESALTSSEDERFMRMAIDEAVSAAGRGELPVGAVIVRDGEPVCRTSNLTERESCALSHAELNAMRSACEKLGAKTLSGCTLYVTLEPCPMCAGAIFLARPDRVVFGAADAEYGAFGGKFDLFELSGFSGSRPAVTGGVLSEECSAMLKAFFGEKRGQPQKPWRKKLVL